MLDGGRHASCVDDWLERCAEHTSEDELLLLFDAALAALWARAKTTLGEVTLTAIADRVVHVASTKFPVLSALQVEPESGIRCRRLRGRTAVDRDADLRTGMRFVLVELLTVVGHLTAEILTPVLHATLSSVTLPQADRIDPSRSKNGDDRS